MYKIRKHKVCAIIAFNESGIDFSYQKYLVSSTELKNYNTLNTSGKRFFFIEDLIRNKS